MSELQRDGFRTYIQLKKQIEPPRTQRLQDSFR